MTRTDRFQSRVAFTLALMLAIAGLAGALRISAVPAGAQVVDSVVVSCDAPAADGSTTCVVSAPGSDQLAVPAGGFCGTLVSASGTFDGASYQSASGDPSVVLTFANPVAVGGGSTYTVTTGGVSSVFGGAGIVCIDAPAAPVLQQTDATDVATDETVSNEPVFDETVTQAVEEQPAVDGAGTETGDEVTSESDDDGTETGSTDADGDGAGGGDGEGSEDGGDAGSEGAGVDGETVGDDTVVPANVIVDPETPNDPPTQQPVTVTIIAYQCDADPGLVDPVTAGCVGAANIDFSARDTSGDLGTATSNGSGVATFASTTGSAFLVEQIDHISGHRIVGDGRYEVLSLDGDITITFVNVPLNALGRLQIVAGLCPTSEASRTEFSIADQHNFGAASLMACGPNSDALYTVTSDSLPGGSWVVRVEGDGSWRGQVPAGIYTVTAPDGTVSPQIWVATGAISVAVAISYVHQDQGTVQLEHFLCTEGTDGEYIQVNPPGAPDASCSPWSATVTVSEFSGGQSEVITIAQNGSTPVGLKPGQYVATGPQGASVAFDITAEATTVVRVLTVATTGVLMIDANRCPAGVTPTDAETQCTSPWGGAGFSLTPSGGGSIPVTVSGNGMLVVDGLTPGTYTLDGANVCVVLSGGVDASGGFTIHAGQTTSVAIYGCFAPDDGTGNPDPGNGGQNPGGGAGGNGDGTGGTGNHGRNPSGGDGTGIGGGLNDYASNSVMTVTQLPNTGSGANASNYWWPALLLALAGGLVLTGYRLRPQVARRRI